MNTTAKSSDNWTEDEWGMWVVSAQADEDKAKTEAEAKGETSKRMAPTM